jgi:hypothetical protein
MRPIKALAAGVFLAVAACGDFNVANEDEPSINALTENPTPAIVSGSAVGLQHGLRVATAGKISTLAHYGREGYYLAVARTALTEFDDPLTPASPNGIGWSTTYLYVNTANALRSALDVLGPEVTAAEKSAASGFAKTIEAYLLHGQLRVQDVVGIVVDTDRDPSAGLAPVVTKAEAFTYILAKYDEAMTDLTAGGGASFPFPLTSGFAGFDTPTSFIAFNRGLKARAALEAGDHAAALGALAASFLDDSPGADLSNGVWNVYSTSSGDQTNVFFDPAGFEYLADTNLVGDAQLISPGVPDLRLTNKTAPTPPLALNSVTSNLKWTIYNTNTAPIPVIKNEELLLIRAEARLLGTTPDLPGALADINYIRMNSGGLAGITSAAWTAMTTDARVDELLYNRRYSLVFEYGHRWVDLRRLPRTTGVSRLLDLEGPRGAGDRIYEFVPLNDDECDGRKNVAPRGGCSQHDGIPGGTLF